VAGVKGNFLINIFTIPLVLEKRVYLCEGYWEVELNCIEIYITKHIVTF
jgi:hypothetical protein